MSQSRTMSGLETLVSTVIGLVVSLISNLVIFRFIMHMPISVADNMMMTAFFTGISIVRGFCVRRLFNWLGERP